MPTTKRLYALYLRPRRTRGPWIRVWDWNHGEYLPALMIDTARRFYQDVLIASCLDGWANELRLRPVR